jgi:hypothetical protein
MNKNYWRSDAYFWSYLWVKKMIHFYFKLAYLASLFSKLAYLNDFVAEWMYLCIFSARYIQI